MNFATLATAVTAASAGRDAGRAPPAAPSGAEDASAFLDVLGLLNGLVAADAEPAADTVSTDVPAETLEDETTAMPAMVPVPTPLQVASAVPMVRMPDADRSPQGGPAPEPLVAAAPVAAPRAESPVAVAGTPGPALPARAEAPVADAPRKASTFVVDDARSPQLVAAVAPQAAVDDPAPALRLSPSTPTQWRQPLAEALGDRLQLSLQRGSEQAVIRLDPPQLGRIEIAIRHEAGSLQVHLSATHGEVVRQLNAIGDSIRQDLGQRQYGDVSVVVSDAGAAGRDADGRSRGRQPQQEEHRPNRALAEAETGLATAFRLGDHTSETR
jgi:flagellar hook-length control protein FliK